MEGVRAAAVPVGSARSETAVFDWLVLAACFWLVGGGFLDNWAHLHVPALESFFTPWHGVLYSGFAVSAAILVVRWLRGPALPAAYRLSLIACGVFAVGGVLDLLWHTIFGIEKGIAAVLSPTHLLLIVAASLLVTGPLRAARAGADGRASMFAVLAAVLVFCYLGLISQVAQPYIDRVAANPRGTLLYSDAVQSGLFGVMLQSALLVGLVLKVRERFELPFGSLTLIMGVQAFAMLAANNLDYMVLVAVLGGLAGDVWLLVLRNRHSLFAIALPATLYAIHVVSLVIVYGTWWEVHTVTGIVVVAGLTGWAVSILVRPRQLSKEDLTVA
jgi:hypothetical protein